MTNPIKNYNKKIIKVLLFLKIVNTLKANNNYNNNNFWMNMN